LRKITSVAIFIVLVAFSVFSQAAKQAKGAAGDPAGARGQLTADFKSKAWRAIDAIDRIPFLISVAQMSATNANLLVDADKAVDEAKYSASTALDKNVLHLLEMAVLSKQDQARYESFSKEWTRDTHRFTQCVTEARFYVTPDVLSASGIETAQKNTCNKKTDEWDEGITR